MEQLDVIREMIQKKIPDKKVRNVFYVTAGIDGKSVYAICGNNNKIFGCAKISPKGEIEIIK